MTRVDCFRRILKIDIFAGKYHFEVLSLYKIDVSLGNKKFNSLFYREEQSDGVVLQMLAVPCIVLFC